MRRIHLVREHRDIGIGFELKSKVSVFGSDSNQLQGVSVALLQHSGRTMAKSLKLRLRLGDATLYDAQVKSRATSPVALG